MGNKSAARIPFFIAILAMLGLVIYLNMPTEEEKQGRRSSAVTVGVVEVEMRPYRDIVSALGTARANEDVTIFPRYAGLVKDVFFEDGEIVRKGKILATLHSEQEQAEVKELTANLAEADSQLQRLKDLRRSKATSISLLEEQQAKVSAINAQLEKAKAKLAEYSISAPFDGVLGIRQVSAGAFISTSDMLSTLDDISVIKVDFTVPERDLTTLKLGQTLEAKNIAYGDRVFYGKITSINSRLDAVTRAVKVRAEIDNADMELRPGMLISVSLERSVEDIIMVPETSIIPIEDRQYVYLAKDGVVERVLVQVGRRRPGFVEILSGIAIGQQVVSEGTVKLRPGAEIKIKGQ